MAEFHLTLRLRLLGLLALSVGLAVLPFSLYTARSLGRGYLEAARADIRNASEMLQAHLETRYLLHMTNQVASILYQKENLRKLGGILSRNWEEMEALSVPQRDLLITNQIRRLGLIGLMVTTIRPDGDFSSPLGQFTSLSDWAGLHDLAGRDLAGLARNPNLSASGEFVVFKAARPGRSEPDFFLVHLLPDLTHRNTLVILMSLDDLETSRRTDARLFAAEGLRERFRELTNLRPGLALGLLGSDGQLLAGHGSSLPSYPWLELRPEARRLERLETVIPVGPEKTPTIVQLTWFKPLDIFLLLTVPESAIDGQSRAVVRRIVWLGALVMVLVLAAGAFFSGRLTGPLNLLTARITDLAQADFSRPETVAGLKADLPVGRGDEVGLLAQAFARMGAALSRNIRDLMAATTAKERLEGELGAARDIQMGILPLDNALPPETAFEATGFLRPAKEVGGDLYDFFPAPDGRLAVIIGDVSDKGVPAALFMAMTVTLTRQALDDGLSPAQALTRVNARLSAHNPENMFVTLFLGLLDPARGEIEYANGGHCQPLLAGGPRGFRRLEGLSGPAVGAWPGLDYIGFREDLDSGETGLLYTDGVTEAQDERDGFFGLDRLENLFQDLAGAEPADINRRIFEAAAAFSGPDRQSDDITLLSFRRRNGI